MASYDNPASGLDGLGFRPESETWRTVKIYRDGNRVVVEYGMLAGDPDRRRYTEEEFLEISADLCRMIVHHITP